MDIEIANPELGMAVRVPVLVDGGPLAVAPVWDWKRDRRVPGLFFIYFRRFGLRIGPFYASIPLAEAAMKKALKAFPRGFWEAQGLEWYQRQGAVLEWMKREMGEPEDLVGGRWASD